MSHTLLASMSDLATLLSSSDEDTIQHLPVAWIEPDPDQPRKAFSDVLLRELADTIIAMKGVIQPIEVRRLGDQRYRLVDGERRWRGSQLAQMPTIRAIVTRPEPELILIRQLIANVQREDMSPLDEAQAIERLIAQLGRETARQALGKSEAYLSQRLALLRLNSAPAALLRAGCVDADTAITLSKLEQRDPVAADTLYTQVKRGERVSRAQARKALAFSKGEPPAESVEPSPPVVTCQSASVSVGIDPVADEALEFADCVSIYGPARLALEVAHPSVTPPLAWVRFGSDHLATFRCDHLRIQVITS